MQLSAKERSSSDALVRWLVLFLMSWQAAFNISHQAMQQLLKFLGRFFYVLAKITYSPVRSYLAPAFPSSLFLIRKYLHLHDKFVTYAVCGRCHSIYKVTECILKNADGSTMPKRCDYVQFPNHRQSYRRIACCGPLLKHVTLSNGKMQYYQRHSYVYMSITDSLERLLMRHGIANKLQHWKERQVPDQCFSDIYDGKVWKEFGDFFARPRNYALMLNLDWFQPFDHTNDSVGVLYMTVLNLPRHERFRRENVLLIGIIPALGKEPSDVNSFLEPVVKELKELQKGVRMHTSESPRYKVTVRALLLCAACDIPAARKLCGFKGHNANYGCSRCLKFFPGDLGSKDYSGFDRDSWTPRNIHSHRQKATEIKDACSMQRNR